MSRKQAIGRVACFLVWVLWGCSPNRITPQIDSDTEVDIASQPDSPALDAPALDAPAPDAPALDAPAPDAPAPDAPAPDAPAPDMSPTDASVPDASVVRCMTSRDCSAPSAVCDTATRRCVQCNVATDCAAGQACLGSRCVTTERCTSSRMCPGQVCNTLLGYCVDCETDVDCTGTQVCRASACVAPPRTCRSSRECSDMAQVCDTVRGQCVDCVADSDCASDRYCGPMSVCELRVCTANATECLSTTRARACNARGSAQMEADCPTAQTCREGRCQATVCAPTRVDCDPMSAQLRRCNDDGGGYTVRPCATGESCRDGACAPRTCVPGAATCASTTARSVCNPDGFGATSVACASNEGCRDGACIVRACAPGAATCASMAARSVCNPDGFGATVSPCGSAQRCTGGVCRDLTCTPGSATCADARTVSVCNSDGSGFNSIGCPGGSTCSGGMCSTWACTPGSIACPTGTSARVICSGDGLSSRVEPCAAPANATTPRCGTDNACVFTCAAGYGDCNLIASDGCEVATAATTAHCGRCGNACALANATAACVGGACRVGACAAGFGNCNGADLDGCESNGVTDPSNCGGCGIACPSGMTCSSGRCVSPCVTGSVFCDGACVNTSSDPRNCGACGSVCGAGLSCVGGACRSVTAPTNDLCAGARTLSLMASSQTITVTTVGAGREVTPPCGSGGADVWFRFTLTQRELVYADTLGSGFDTILWFASGCTTPLAGMGTAGAVHCNDDLSSTGCTGGGSASQVVAMLTAGTYYLVLAGSGAASGSATLRFQHLAVGNGAVSSLPSGMGAYSGTTGGTGVIAGPCRGANAPENTYWWRSCPETAAGMFTATTCMRASWDTVLYLRNAGGLGDVCDDDSCGTQSTVSTTVGSGAGLHVLYVDGYAAGAFGAYSVAIRRP